MKLRRFIIALILLIINIIPSVGQSGSSEQILSSSGPENGHLLLIGGGSLDAVFFEIVAEFGGGYEEPLIIIPTAIGKIGIARDPEFSRIKEAFKKRGFSNITILHTYDRQKADTEHFIDPIRKAKAVWITGGRQWRLVDSYAGTRTEEALHDLLDRGGIIAGTSAGASIQGSFLVRGDTRKNTIMDGDHKIGFGFLTNVGIDQHVLRRNRQFDLFEIREKYPNLLCFGIDENTGLLISGNKATVVGRNYVLVYDGKLWDADKNKFIKADNPSECFYFLRPGNDYDLSKWQKID